MHKKKKIELILNEYSCTEEMDTSDQLLIKKAIGAGRDAYAPYSGFSVGAALKLDSGEVITGNNRENASFPAGLCAEHTAIAYAGANYPGSAITSIAVCAGKNGIHTDEPVSPCGICRQVLSEEEDRSGKEIKIILYGKSRIYVIDGVKNLLPLHFSSSAIGY